MCTCSISTLLWITVGFTYGSAGYLVTFCWLLSSYEENGSDNDDIWMGDCLGDGYAMVHSVS